MNVNFVIFLRLQLGVSRPLIVFFKKIVGSLLLSCFIHEVNNG
jgi:hypothetical protein